MGILEASVDTQRRTALAVGFVAVAVTILVAAGIALAPRSGQSQPANNTTLTEANQGYGSGYPQHGGLAGPSRIEFVEMWGYGPGYPQHGGLAGPSRAGSDQ